MVGFADEFCHGAMRFHADFRRNSQTAAVGNQRTADDKIFHQTRDFLQIEYQRVTVQRNFGVEILRIVMGKETDVVRHRQFQFAEGLEDPFLQAATETVDGGREGFPAFHGGKEFFLPAGIGIPDEQGINCAVREIEHELGKKTFGARHQGTVVPETEHHNVPVSHFVKVFGGKPSAGGVVGFDGNVGAAPSAGQGMNDIQIGIGFPGEAEKRLFIRSEKDQTRSGFRFLQESPPVLPAVHGHKGHVAEKKLLLQTCGHFGNDFVFRVITEEDLFLRKMGLVVETDAVELSDHAAAGLALDRGIIAQDARNRGTADPQLSGYIRLRDFVHSASPESI